MNLQARVPNAALPVALLCGVLTFNTSVADDLVPAQRDLFETHVRPVLVQHCIKCHGPSRQESGLQLTSRAAVTKGGDSGAVMVPGDPDSSLLLEALRYESLEMPPDEPLPPEQVAGIEAWIQAGAPWPADTVLTAATAETASDTDWWCYQPIEDPAVPDVDSGGWCRNEIDRFVYAKLQANEITPSPAADELVLVRRLHYAVTGLPPTDVGLESVDGQQSWEALIDRLMDSPAYGENQARPWLDLVRYADSDGYRADHKRPQAKLYRDYVIRSSNEDKPYDRFVTEQLAGDEVDPGNRDALVATMFLRHWIYEYNQRDVEQQWSEILSDITETTSDAFLAQGIRCARCHDHKFDPIQQQDYFRLRAFFAGLQPREDMPVGTVDTRREYARQYQKWQTATEELRKQIHAIETPVLLKNSTKEGFAKFVPEIKAMMLAREADRSPYEHQIASLALRQLDQHPEKLPDQLDAKTEARRQELRKQLATFDSIKPDPLPTLEFVASDVGPVAPVTWIPGDPDKTPVAPGFLSVFDDQPAQIAKPPQVLQSTGRRSALARWITADDNPLTARVIVNRIWQQHFGRGLVETSSDFGHLGSPPSHPQLLDWLASRLIEDNWSLKKLHRRILSSATWRQTSQRPADARLLSLDPDNTLLWRMSPRRLTAEEIMDTLLSVSGELPSKKRAIYLPVIRNKRNPVLAAFDFPDRIRSTGERHRTTTSPQALMMMNNTWLHERATAMAATMQQRSDVDLVKATFGRVYFRDADDDDLTSAAQFMASYSTSESTETEGVSPESSRIAFLHAVMISNELIYVD